MLQTLLAATDQVENERIIAALAVVVFLCGVFVAVAKHEIVTGCALMIVAVVGYLLLTSIF